MEEEYSFHSSSDILDLTQKHRADIAEIAIQNSVESYEYTKEQVLGKMNEIVKITSESIDFGIKNEQRTKSGLSGGDAKKLSEMKDTIVGDELHTSITYAIAITEANALHGRVVAFPTAGASGVVPATLLGYAKCRSIPDELLVKAYFVSGAIGIIIAENAMISGAAGGCQAEVGSATAMAAAGLGYICGLNNKQIMDASAIALKSMLGLVCDPIAGLVECPCIKRNAIGVANAYTAVEIVKSGIESNVPLDEVISAMKEIGLKMNPKYKETADGGIAATKTGKLIWKRLFGKLF
jgi:L-serine dehydratase